jgi:hypothetical protein
MYLFSHFSKMLKQTRSSQNHKGKPWLNVFRPSPLSSLVFRCKYIQSTAGSNHWTTNVNAIKLGLASCLSCKPDGRFLSLPLKWAVIFVFVKKRYCWLWYHCTVVGVTGSLWTHDVEKERLHALLISAVAESERSNSPHGLFTQGKVFRYTLQTSPTTGLHVLQKRKTCAPDGTWTLILQHMAQSVHCRSYYGWCCCCCWWR